MKPLYIVGTQRDIGKTTFSVGLIHAIQQRGLRVAYVKPLGQRVGVSEGQAVHEDALVVSRAMAADRGGGGAVPIAVPLTRGRVEKEILDLKSPDLAERVVSVCKGLSADNDLVLIEGMGHVAAGAVLSLSAGDVARMVGAKALLVGGGGIGRAIDELMLCGTFMTARGAELMGVVINKVWQEKYDRVKEATTKGLAKLGIRSFGAVPFVPVLSSPTVGQIAKDLGGRILCGENAMGSRIGKVIVAAMETNHMVAFLRPDALVITPGDRNDNILAILSTHVLEKTSGTRISGLILTGGFAPDGRIKELLLASGLPTVQFDDDTYSVATRIQDTVFKTRPDDGERIQIARDLIARYIDVDGILAGLKE